MYAATQNENVRRQTRLGDGCGTSLCVCVCRGGVVSTDGERTEEETVTHRRLNTRTL